MGGLETANPVIICGSGPCLEQVPYRDPGYPLAAISTAIQTVPDPDYWILVDRIQPEHGDEGKAAARNLRIKKVVPGDREKVFRGFPNVELVPRFHPGDASGHTFMDGKKGVVTGLNRSMLFAVQWLGKHFDTLIFAGVDLQAKDSQLWVHGFEPRQKNRVVSMSKGLQREHNQLKQWAPIAAERGVRWLSWSPGSPINRFLEEFIWTPTLSPSSSSD